MDINAPKLSEEQRIEIVSRVEAGESKRSLAIEYGVSEATIRKTLLRRAVKNEGKQQSYRENLSWALAAAGEFLRTKKRPTVCPNDSAWFLFTQAMKEPRDFMAKVAQVEKADDGEAERNARASAQRSIAEIDSMLSELEADDGETQG